jgi:hypothetical protein
MGVHPQVAVKTRPLTQAVLTRCAKQKRSAAEFSFPLQRLWYYLPNLDAHVFMELKI